MSEMIFLNEEIRGSCYLAKSDGAAVIFDPGMIYFAGETIEKIKNILGSQPVDAVFLTHSHYDHVAALPYIRMCWPDVKVYGADYAKQVLVKSSARETILELSREAAEINGRSWKYEYPLDLLYVDEAIGDGEVIEIGDMRVKAIETMGHTRCSISFIIDDWFLLASESIGTINDGERYMPQFLTSYEKALESIRKCRGLGKKQLFLTHNGEIGETSEQLWQWFENGIVDAKNLILNILKEYQSPEDRMELMAKYFWVPKRKGSWPRPAFELNAQAMMRTISREFISGE